MGTAVANHLACFPTEDRVKQAAAIQRPEQLRFILNAPRYTTWRDPGQGIVIDLDTSDREFWVQFWADLAFLDDLGDHETEAPETHEYSNFDAPPGETQEAASAHADNRQTTIQLDSLSLPPRFSPLLHNLPPPELSSDEPSAADDTTKASTGKARAAGRDEAEPEAVQHTPLMELPE
ncbi:hypothetical protein ACM66B_004605 [Microbotryomycetes sp. NB124-2]